MKIQRSAVVLGLPGSGKTTFLAAMWHLLTAREVPSALELESLQSGNLAHLNRIATRWRDGREQDRTDLAGNHIVTLNLLDQSRQGFSLAFPDIAGEAYRQMWEERVCKNDLLEHLKAPSVVLFIHADRIRAPQWVVDVSDLARQLGLPTTPGAEVPWHPRLAPTQVPLVDLLQMLQSPSLAIGPRRLAILLSAWEKVQAEGLAPSDYLKAKLPLLAQYLRANRTEWNTSVFGVSAQGGEYEAPQNDANPVEINPETEKLREIDQPSRRIQLWDGCHRGHDITVPIEWALQWQ